MVDKTKFDPQSSIGQVDELLEALRYSLELNIEQDKIVDEDSVQRILRTLGQVQTTLKPFSSEDPFSKAYPEADGVEFVDSVIKCANLFITNPDLSVENVKMDLSTRTNPVDLLPYLECASKEDH